jgi:prephenate dehydrogenase
MRIALLGLGLIGGSIARALREIEPGDGALWIGAWTPGGQGPKAAVASGVIDLAAGTPGIALEGADLVVLAAPPRACVALLERLGRELRPCLAEGVTVTDVASTKAVLLGAARAAEVPYVGGHPMAGREASGFSAADGSLFRGRPWVITEAVGGGDPDAVRDLARRCGARVVDLDAATHDRLVAAISHLPLLTSVALVEAVAGTGAPAPDWPAASSLSATGWRDTTRLARGDVTMGAEIAATNARAIAAHLRVYRERLDEWLALLEAPGGPDMALIRDRLVAAKARVEG